MKDSGEVRQQGISARRRAALAKQRELAAHQRAIELHERAAELQERLGYPDRAANARQHAEHARQLLAKGREEQREQEAVAAGRHEGVRPPWDRSVMSDDDAAPDGPAMPLADWRRPSQEQRIDAVPATSASGWPRRPSGWPKEGSPSMKAAPSRTPGGNIDIPSHVLQSLHSRYHLPW
jgi:hypothetical protein